jgi:uncharacterized repeat protein (TIGR01451 family)
MLRLKMLVLLVTLTVLTLSSAVVAEKESAVELWTLAEVEVEIITEDGEKQIQRIEAAKVIPGDEVIYTIRYANTGSEPADNIVITDPIPEHMLYRDGSASGEGASVTFSVDDGRSFDVAENLKVAAGDGTERPARPSDYTHIKWTLEGDLKPDAGGFVTFRAELQ